MHVKKMSLFSLPSVTMSISYERKLLKNVIKNYKCEECLVARPVEKEPETMSVEFGIALIQVVELDEKRQTVTTHMWEYLVSSAAPSELLGVVARLVKGFEGFLKVMVGYEGL